MTFSINTSPITPFQRPETGSLSPHLSSAHLYWAVSCFLSEKDHLLRLCHKIGRLTIQLTLPIKVWRQHPSIVCISGRLLTVMPNLGCRVFQWTLNYCLAQTWLKSVPVFLLLLKCFASLQLYYALLVISDIFSPSKDWPCLIPAPTSWTCPCSLTQKTRAKLA